jgi:hypothetical protein
MKDNMLGNSQLSNGMVAVDNKENIKVIVRIRPKIEREYDQGIYLKVDGNSIITSHKSDNKQYTFDYIATEESSQSEIFDHCARGICDSTLQGYNGTIFVYGQTGAGKTFTLLGPKFSSTSNVGSKESSESSYNRYIYKKEEENKGVLPRVIDYLFEKSKQMDNSTVTFSCSFLEIYQESISDLLDSSTNKHISIRDLSDSVIVEGLSKIMVTSAEEALNLVSRGIKVRHVGATKMNDESSRSHAVFSIYIENKQKTLGGKFKTKKSVFHLIDLAGSERQKTTEAFGERLKEAGKINKSLMQLGHVIKSLLDLAEGKKCHIHYRDSKLTHLLKDSLGGNSKTCIIANISPANCNYQETVSTLIFAQSAKLIKNKAIINEELSHDNAYREEIKKLRDKYNSIKAENLYLLSIIEKNKSESKSSSGEQFCKTLDYVESEIETIVNEMVTKEEQIKLLQSDNDFLKEKIQSSELELRIKEKELRELKEMSKTISQEHELIKTQLREYVLKDAYMTQRISQLENMLQNKEFLLNKEIDALKFSIEDNKRLVETKEAIIHTLNGEIKNYMNLINQRDLKISDLKLELESKEAENDELRKEIENRQTKEDNLLNQIDFHKQKLESREMEVRVQEEKFDNLRRRGKELCDQYDNKIGNYKTKLLSMEEETKKNKEEIKNLNAFIEHLKKERELAEQKVFLFMEDVRRTNLEKESLKEENFRLGEDLKSVRLEYGKILEENELLSDNRNLNNNKVSLLNKLKQENSKYKEEINELRKNLEYFEKTLNLRQNLAKLKTNPLDFGTLMRERENELNECHRIMHTLILRIKHIFDCSKDEFCDTFKQSMKNFLEDKSLCDKFGYYFDKFCKYLEVIILYNF